MIKILSKPWEVLLRILTPRSKEGGYLFIHFLVPFILIWNVSEIELFILEKIMKRVNVSANFLGLTISAWGNNAPDMFNIASAMSKGMVDLAINAAIASQIHSILLGLGLPWIIYNLTKHKSLTYSSNNLYAFTLFFFCFFVLSFIICFKMNKLKFDTRFALFLIVTYILFLFMIFFITFQLKN
jgi:Ca2+/Na+ antiporter